MLQLLMTDVININTFFLATYAFEQTTPSEVLLGVGFTYVCSLG